MVLQGMTQLPFQVVLMAEYGRVDRLQQGSIVLGQLVTRYVFLGLSGVDGCGVLVIALPLLGIPAVRPQRGGFIHWP